MVFGLSPSDFVTVPQLAWRVYTVLKDAPGAHKALSQEVLSLQQILVRVETNINNKTRILGQEEAEQLNEITRGCKDVLEEVDSMLQVCKADGRGVLFGRVKFATKDTALIRSRIAAQVDRLNAFNGFLVLSSQDRTEHKLDKVIELLKRRGSVVSIESMASVLHKKQGWETFGRALEDKGITLKMVQERHSFAVRLLAAAVNRAQASDKAASDEVAVKFASFNSQSMAQTPEDTSTDSFIDCPPAAKNNKDGEVNPNNFEDSSEDVPQRNFRPRQFHEIDSLVGGPERFKPQTDRSSISSRSSGRTLFVSRNRLDSASLQAAIEIVAGARGTDAHSAQTHEKHSPATLRMSVQYNPIDFKNVLKQHPATNFGDTMYGQAQRMALDFAALFGVVEILIILLRSDARPDARTISGKTPLHIAVYGEHTRIVQRLLRNNIGMSFRDLRVWLLSQSAAQHLKNTVQIPCICPDIVAPLDSSCQLVKGEVSCGSPSCVAVLKEDAKIYTLPAPQSNKIAIDWLVGNGQDLSSLCGSCPDPTSTVVDAISHVLEYWHDQGICRILLVRFPRSQNLLRDVVSNGRQRVQGLVYRSRHRAGGHARHHQACARCLSLMKPMKASILQTLSAGRRESFLKDAAMDHGQTALTMALNSYSSLLLDELVGHGYNEIAGRKVREELGF